MPRHWLLAGNCSNLLPARSTKETAAAVLQVYREGGEKGDTAHTAVLETNPSDPEQTSPLGEYLVTLE